MIETIVLNYLNQNLPAGVSAYMQRPDQAPERFVLLEKTGSGVKNHVHSAMFAIQSYAETLYQAAVLNEEVKGAMDCLTEEDEISHCKLNSDYNFTDTDRKEYRYQAVYDIVY